MRKPLLFLIVGVLLGITAFAILVWILSSADDRAVQRSTPPPEYLQASAQ
ncbi:hypothetical protein [Nonomuraea phyllanthi]|nr:hypothetical protein [Nonomuraea phyllanthi]